MHSCRTKHPALEERAVAELSSYSTALQQVTSACSMLGCVSIDVFLVLHCGVCGARLHSFNVERDLGFLGSGLWGFRYLCNLDGQGNPVSVDMGILKCVPAGKLKLDEQLCGLVAQAQPVVVDTLTSCWNRTVRL